MVALKERKVGNDEYKDVCVLRLMPIAAISLCVAGGCASPNETRAPNVAHVSAAPVAPPLPERYKSGNFTDFYPDASRRAREGGEVVVIFTIGPKGTADEPITVDQEKSATSPRLQMAARQIVQNLGFPLGDTYKRTLTASIVFEISACGSVRHSAAADYDWNLCLKPPADPNLSQVQGSVTPSCYGTPYGAQKANSHKPVEVPVSDPPAPPEASLAPMRETVRDRIRIQAKPLEYPPEIARIKRGYISSFVGAFINDGLASWSGIDLDRMEVISVQRRIYDRRATLTKPFDEPTFQTWDNRSFERKWSSKDRTEMEAVLIGDLEGPDANAFVCIANKIWERDEPSTDEIPSSSDTLSSSSILIDTTVVGGKTFQSGATVLPQGPLTSVIKAIEGSMPTLEYKTTAKKGKGRAP
jgi:TonB family protein